MLKKVGVAQVLVNVESSNSLERRVVFLVVFAFIIELSKEILFKGRVFRAVPTVFSKRIKIQLNLVRGHPISFDTRAQVVLRLRF